MKTISTVNLHTRPLGAALSVTRPTALVQELATSKPVTGLLRKIGGRVFGRMGWGLADQAVSSLTNVTVSFYLVHTLAAGAFGAFSLAYVTYGFALNASRGLSTDPLMVRFSGAETNRWRSAVAGATGTAIAVGVACGVLSIIAAIIIGGVTGAAFLALGITLPGLMLQDSWRYSFFAHGRGMHAFLNDMIWAAVMLPAIAALRLTGHATVFWVLFAWGASACVGGLVGPFQARVWPGLSGMWRWVYRHRDLGPRYLIEGTVNNAGYQVRGYGTGLLLGLSALGWLQASVTLFGPTTILFSAMGLVTIPEAARVLRRAPARLPLFAAAVSVGLSAFGLAWGVILLVALPKGLGHLLVGAIWKPTFPLVLPTTVAIMGSSFGIGPGAGLHALGASRKTLRSAIFGTTTFIGFSVAGTALFGVAGTCWGTALSTWLSTAVYWWQFRLALRQQGIAHTIRVRRLPDDPLGHAAQPSPVQPYTMRPVRPGAHRRPSHAVLDARTMRIPARRAQPRHARNRR